MPVTDHDRGTGRLLAALRGLSGTRLTVGVHADDGAAMHPGSGSAVSSVAMALEVGTQERAPVAWLRGAIDSTRAALGPSLVKAASAVVKGASRVDAYGPVLRGLVHDMRAAVPSRTGTVRNAITGRVDGAKVAL